MKKFIIIDPCYITEDARQVLCKKKALEKGTEETIKIHETKKVGEKSDFGSGLMCIVETTYNRRSTQTSSRKFRIFQFQLLYALVLILPAPLLPSLRLLSMSSRFCF